MIRSRRRGSVLVIGLQLLALVNLLGLAGAFAARVELQLARNAHFRDNAASAASAGIESAISRIVTSTTPETLGDFAASLPALAASFEVQLRVLGHEVGLPQAPGSNLSAVHLEIIATGHAPRGGYDRQRAIVRVVRSSPLSPDATPCEPRVAGVRCAIAGDWRRVAWQRLGRP